MSTVPTNVITVAHPSVHKTKQGFTIVKNAIIENFRLSSEARILLIYLVSRRENWTFYDDNLRKIVGCGINKLKSLFQELCNEGYVRIVKVQAESGLFYGSKREFSDDQIFINENNNIIREYGNRSVGTESTETESTETVLSAPYINNTERDNNTDHNQDLFLNNKNKYMCENVSSATESRSYLLENEIKKEKISRSEAEKVFDRLWQEYPVKKGRGKALERFLKKTRTLTPEKLKNVSETILDRMLAYAMEKELYARARKQYPHLNTFCAPYQNGDRWFGSTCWSEDSYLNTYDEVCHEIINRPENINKKPSRSQAMASIFVGGYANV